MPPALSAVFSKVSASKGLSRILFPVYLVCTLSVLFYTIIANYSLVGIFIQFQNPRSVDFLKGSFNIQRDKVFAVNKNDNAEYINGVISAYKGIASGIFPVFDAFGDHPLPFHDHFRIARRNKIVVFYCNGGVIKSNG